MLRSPGRRLRDALRDDRFVVAPGAFDCVSARVVARAGFECMYVTGHGVSNSALGFSDVGLMTFPELARHAKAMIEAVDIPVIVDVDTGYGAPINVQRTVREMERIGAAAVQIEDQQWPKKCGHMPGKQLISEQEMVQKLRAAADARVGELVLVARTDALAVEGLDAAVRRCKLYADAGADVLFIDALGDRDECRQAVSQLSVPVMANMVEGSRTHYASSTELRELGFRLGIWPISLLLTAITSMRAAAAELREHGRLTPATTDRTMDFPEFLEFWDFEDIRRLEARYDAS